MLKQNNLVCPDVCVRHVLFVWEQIGIPEGNTLVRPSEHMTVSHLYVHITFLCSISTLRRHGYTLHCIRLYIYTHPMGENSC